MILVLLPDIGYHPAELSVPCKALLDAGFELQFVTLSGKKSRADDNLLDVKSCLLTRFFTGSSADQRKHRELIKSDAFCNPKSITDTNLQNAQGIFIPGGFGKGMKAFIESAEVWRLLADAFIKNLPVATVGQAVRVLTRVVDPRTGVPVIYDRKTTGLPKWFEHAAWMMTRKTLGDHFKMYPGYLEQEVRANLHHQRNFLSGSTSWIFALGHNSPCVIQDRQYLSARWTADCDRLSLKFIALLKNIPLSQPQPMMPQQVCLG